MRGPGCIALGLVLALTAEAGAADLTVEIGAVEDARGRVLVAVCTPQTFLTPTCPWRVSAEARAGSTTVVVRDLPPGTYALQAFHDINGNGQIDRNFLGMPREGIGFGNDAAMLFGPPRFDHAAVEIGEPGTVTSLTMRYLIER